MSGSWQAERGSRRTRRLPHEDPRVVVGVGPMARIWNSVPVVTFCSWKHTLSVESFSVNVWMLYIKFCIQVAVIRLSAIVCMTE